MEKQKSSNDRFNWKLLSFPCFFVPQLVEDKSYEIFGNSDTLSSKERRAPPILFDDLCYSPNRNDYSFNLFAN
eukprot:2903624-Amphidinium_carterae.1